MNDIMAAVLEGIKDKGLAEARGYHIESLKKQNADLLDALVHLCSEVKGSWSLCEPSIRELIGNTNYACVQHRLDEATAVIAKARASMEAASH